MDGLKESIREMSKEIPASTTEIAAIAESAGQLGIQTESIEGFTRVMADLGEATNLTSEQAATEFSRFANIVGMSQDDFDKLGSTVVDLGNNLATTESEISEMALRLAGAGEQVGMTESEILSFSAALSSVGIRAEAGGSSFSKVMVEMQLAAEKGGDSLDSFAKVAGVSAEEFKKAYEKDATGAIMQFIEGLSTAEDRGLSAIGILDEMGISEIRMRDALLRAAGASDVFSESLEIGSKAWKENTALTEEAEKRYATTESQLKIMWNRIKDVGITLGEVLVPAVMDAIDAAEPFIQKIEDGAQAFSEMNEEEQRSIMKMVGFAAAIGPASIVLGGLTTTVGGALRVFGSLSAMLGTAKGAGLLARIGGLGVAGPVGLAIAGVAGLGVAMHAMNKESGRTLEETLKMIDARKKEIDENDKLISSYDELRKQNQLSTDEVLRYMDIIDELKDAEGEKAIKKLKDEQAKLLEKSGLTNEEMTKFLDANDKIVEKSPSTVDAISEQGNAYAGVVDELKELNAAERERLTGETQNALSSEMIKQRDRLAEQKELQGELSAMESERDKKLQNINDSQQSLVNKTGHERRIAEKLLEADRKSYDNLLERIEGKEKEIGKNAKELEQFEMLKDDYAQMVLYEQGIVAEKGKANAAIRQEQKEIDTARNKLKKQWEQGKINRAEYEKQNEKIKDQQNNIDTAKEKLKQMNDIAGRTVYKDIHVRTRTDDEYRRLDDTISKQLNVISSGGGRHLSYAEGTNYHTGGPALVGEEGPELVNQSGKWSLQSFGIMPELSAGAKVFTHEDSMKMLSAMNKLPGYASGVGTNGDADRIINSLNGQQDSGQMNNLIGAIYSLASRPASFKINGRELVLATIDDTSNELQALQVDAMRGDGFA